MKTKDEIRRMIRREKEKYTPDNLRARSEAIWAQVEAMEEFRRARTVAAYWSLQDEVYSHEAVRRWAVEKRVALPVMCNGNDLILSEFLAEEEMCEVRFGIREPRSGTIDPGQVEMIVVPGVAFDRRNHRLGRGRGYYDRLLGRMEAVKIGVCFDFQLLDEIPVEEHDVRMDRVIGG